LSDPDLKALVAADRAAAEALPVIDRLMSRAFQQANPEMTWLFREQGTFNAAKMQDLRNLSASGPTTAEVIAAGVRVYFLAGEEDAVLRPATVRAAHARLPGSVLSIVPDAPHSMYWERPALFNAEVHKALQEFYGP
jgi:pimeloyl-ACP methyl ester carboxylesterase